MRPEMVDNGVKFLRHPSVQTTPLSERVSFLEQKGLTKEEIQEAIERFQSGDAADAFAPPPAMLQPQLQPPAMLSAPMAIAAAAPMQQLIRKARYPPYIRVLWAVSSLVGAASILGFLWNYAVQSGYVPWLRTPLMLTAGKAKDEEDERVRQDEALVTSLTDVSVAIRAQTTELAQLSASLDTKERELATKNALTSQIATTLAEQTTSQAIADLKAEISTLKALLLAKPHAVATSVETPTTATTEVAATAATTAVSPVVADEKVAAVATLPPRVLIARADKLEATLKLVRTQNSLEQLKLAAGILTMYVKNLVENPDVPRYRRIAPGNANFKQKVEPLQHHEDLLKAIGFETNGLNMEWKWHTADRATGEFDDNLALLRAVLQSLQSLTSPSSSSSLSLEEIAHASLDAYREQNANKTTKTLSRTSFETGTGSGSSAATSTTDLKSFMARLEKKASSVGDVSGKKAVEPETLSTPTVSSDAIVTVPELEEKAPAAAVAVAPETEEEKLPGTSGVAVENAAGPSYPKSFNEVMALIQRGETVPGIKDIEEKVSVDSDALLKSATLEGEGEGEEEDDVVARVAAPAKPWEKVQG